MSEQTFATPDKRSNMKSSLMASARYFLIAAAGIGILVFKKQEVADESLVIIAAIIAILFSALYMSKEEIKGSLKVLLVVAAVVGLCIEFGSKSF